jgi:hypothetical protein
MNTNNTNKKKLLKRLKPEEEQVLTVTSIKWDHILHRQVAAPFPDSVLNSAGTMLSIVR